MACKVCADGAGVIGTSRGQSKSNPVCSNTSSTVWPGCTLARAKRLRPRSNANRQGEQTSALQPLRQNTCPPLLAKKKDALVTKCYLFTSDTREIGIKHGWSHIT